MDLNHDTIILYPTNLSVLFPTLKQIIAKTALASSIQKSLFIKDLEDKIDLIL